MRLNQSGDADTFELAMCPLEWKEVYALATFGQLALEYDCEAPYVTQVLVYELDQPEDLNSSTCCNRLYRPLIRRRNRFTQMGEVVPKSFSGNRRRRCGNF
jgi:hypothetical protein